MLYITFFVTFDIHIFILNAVHKIVANGIYLEILYYYDLKYLSGVVMRIKLVDRK